MSMFDRIAQELEPKLNLPLGSGYPADPVTKKFSENLGDHSSDHYHHMYATVMGNLSASS